METLFMNIWKILAIFLYVHEANAYFCARSNITAALMNVEILAQNAKPIHVSNINPIVVPLQRKT